MEIYKITKDLESGETYFFYTKEKLINMLTIGEYDDLLEQFLKFDFVVNGSCKSLIKQDGENIYTIEKYWLNK